MRVQSKLSFGESAAHITTFQMDQSQILKQSSAPTPATELGANTCQVITFKRLRATEANLVLGIPTVI